MCPRWLESFTFLTPLQAIGSRRIGWRSSNTPTGRDIPRIGKTSSQVSDPGTTDEDVEDNGLPWLNCIWLDKVKKHLASIGKEADQTDHSGECKSPKEGWRHSTSKCDRMQNEETIV